MLPKEMEEQPWAMLTNKFEPDDMAYKLEMQNDLLNEGENEG